MLSMVDEAQMELIDRLVERLERLSADSTYAHQASGLRGTLLRQLERLEAGTEVNVDELDQLVERGYEILRDAAREIGAR
ncbi:MAG: hypothetical protein A2136_03700 [Chloroflexi bacterium RBG_16_54_11]|nr:MAG: hypothetical protein A2136_03700 [Chloroflexi bacterium RBG_16_54_11]